MWKVIEKQNFETYEKHLRSNQGTDQNSLETASTLSLFNPSHLFFFTSFWGVSDGFSLHLESASSENE